MAMTVYEDAIKFHGHACPGLAIGYRVAELALRELGAKRSYDEELVAIVENNSCAVDAVQVATGCTFGKGNLIYRDYGKQVYTFVLRPSGKALRIAVDWKHPEDTPEEAEAWRRYSEGDRTEDVAKIVHERKSKKMQAVLDCPEAEMFKLTPLEIKPPEAARIYRSLRCARCGEKTMEPRMRLLRGRTLCLPCFGTEEGES